MSKGDTEEQRARDRLREKLYRRRGPRKRTQPRMTGRKICLCCGETKGIKRFGVHWTSPDGRRYECRMCRWEERWHRQLEWSKKHMPEGPTKEKMRELMRFRQPEKTKKIWEYWRLSYEALGYEKVRFGSMNLRRESK